MAPELILSLGHGKPVDLWSLGVLIYELLCAATPFDVEAELNQVQTRDQRGPISNAKLIQAQGTVQLNQACTWSFHNFEISAPPLGHRRNMMGMMISGTLPPEFGSMSQLAHLCAMPSRVASPSPQQSSPGPPAA